MRVLAKKTTEVDGETKEGLWKKPDPTYVHVVKTMPPEEAMTAVSAVLKLPKVQEVYRRMDIEPLMHSYPRESVRRSLVDLVEWPSKCGNSCDYNIALEAKAVLGWLYCTTRKLELYKREEEGTTTSGGGRRRSRSDDEEAGPGTKKQRIC